MAYPQGEETMDNMLIVGIMVVLCILINPFISASETKKVASAEEVSEDDEMVEEDEEVAN